MAGPAGFEPANAGTKTQCLTAWRRSNNLHYTTFPKNLKPQHSEPKPNPEPKLKPQNPQTLFLLCFSKKCAIIEIYAKKA